MFSFVWHLMHGGLTAATAQLAMCLQAPYAARLLWFFSGHPGQTTFSHDLRSLRNREQYIYTPRHGEAQCYGRWLLAQASMPACNLLVFLDQTIVYSRLDNAVVAIPNTSALWAKSLKACTGMVRSSLRGAFHASETTTGSS